MGRNHTSVNQGAVKLFTAPWCRPVCAISQHLQRLVTHFTLKARSHEQHFGQLFGRHQIKKVSQEAAEFFWCANRSKSAFSNVLVCERFQTPVDCFDRVRRKTCRPKCCRKHCSCEQGFSVKSSSHIYSLKCHNTKI